MSLLLVFLRNLVVTAAVEGAAVLWIRRDRHFLFYSLLCNLLTNPLVNLLLVLSVWGLGRDAYYPALALLEVLAVAAEAVVYRRLGGLSKRWSLWLSLLLNALSFLAGLLLNLLT